MASEKTNKVELLMPKKVGQPIKIKISGKLLFKLRSCSAEELSDGYAEVKMTFLTKAKNLTIKAVR